MDENEVAKIVVDSAYQIHKTLGPGLLEKAYEECLCYELRKRGLMVEKEKLLPIIYDDLKIENAYRIDLLVENIVVVELKSVSVLLDIHLSQTLTYMKLGGYKLGLLINFNETLIKNGIRRIVNKL